MRVAIVTESFLPQVNGVTNTVRHVARRLDETGHRAMVVAPGAGPSSYHGMPVVRTRAIGLPGYRTFPIGLPDAQVERALADFAPDLVHLASPIMLGALGLRAARRLGLPVVAVYQTDVSGFARQYGLRADPMVDRWVARLHRRCDRTLVPSRASFDQLTGLGVPDVHLWRRGVALDLFRSGHRDEALRASWLRGGPGDASVTVGYVGRLAAEKQVRRLAELGDLPGVRLVVIGDGPERGWLENRLPGAVFTGMLSGEELATAFASLDVFVHTGVAETFCQTVQEAQAAGVPVVAPAVGGPVDLVDHGRTGLLYDPDHPPALRDCVRALVADAGVRAEIAGAARAEVTGRGWPTVVDELVEEHYRPVLGAPHRWAA